MAPCSYSLLFKNLILHDNSKQPCAAKSLCSWSVHDISGQKRSVYKGNIIPKRKSIHLYLKCLIGFYSSALIVGICTMRTEFEKRIPVYQMRICGSVVPRLREYFIFKFLPKNANHILLNRRRDP